MKSQISGLKGRVALISGGGTGIGKGIAIAFAEAGAKVALCGRRVEPLESVRAEIEALGAECTLISADVCKAEDCKRAVAAVVEHFGALHILVNNAGIARMGPLSGMSDDDIAGVFDTNLKGVALLSKYAFDALSAAGAGASVLNIGSSVAEVPLKDFSVYSASKAGVCHFTRCLALEWAPKRIRVNCINPGVVETPIHTGTVTAAQAEQSMKMYARATPLGRVGQPVDIADAAIYLSLADWVTGAVLTVDGGIALT